MKKGWIMGIGVKLAIVALSSWIFQEANMRAERNKARTEQERLASIFAKRGDYEAASKAYMSAADFTKNEKWKEAYMAEADIYKRLAELDKKTSLLEQRMKQVKKSPAIAKGLIRQTPP